MVLPGGTKNAIRTDRGANLCPTDQFLAQQHAQSELASHQMLPPSGNHLGAFSSFTMASRKHKDLQDLVSKPTLSGAK